jgi:GntR family transcriptional regulator/MocR family aminotransferase
LRAHGAEVIGMPVHSQGFDCDAGREPSRLARLAYVTPGCQSPFGVPMSRERRLKLLQWASEADAWIFEDDCRRPLHSGERSPPALYGLDRGGTVIYCNSFSRMLFPSLRLGVLILPSALIEPAAAALSITQPYRSMLEQAILADFAREGQLAL